MRASKALGITLATVALSLTGAASAAVHYDPFGSSANTQAVVCSDMNDGWSQWIGWRNKDTGDCAWTYLGGGGGWSQSFWTEDIGVGMQAGNDSVMIPNLPITFCGYEVRAPLIDGYSLQVDGNSGNDVLISLINPGTPRGYYGILLLGGDGDDVLYTKGDYNTLNGEGGNDTLVSSGYMPHGEMHGWSGSDCLYYKSSIGGYGPLMNCSPAGPDYWAGDQGAWTSPDCTYQSTNCCGFGCGSPPAVPSW